MNRAVRTSLASILLAVVVGAAAPMSAAIAVTPENVSVDPEKVPKLARVEVPFEHPVTFEDALGVSEVAGADVVAYRYENPEVVGEYGLASDQTPAEFLASFREFYGTSPAVVAAIVMQDREAVTEGSARAQAPGLVVPLETAPFTPAPVAVDSPAVASLQENLARAESAKAIDRSSSASSAATASTWHPDYADIQIWDAGSYGMYFTEFISWYSLDTSPTYLQDHWGLEFQVDIYTSHPDYQGGSRPFCNGGYKERPFAANTTNNWNWSVFVGSPVGLIPGSGYWGAYPDYNDSGDPCDRNSMAIGIADPHELPTDGAAAYVLQLNLLAPKGADASGRIGGQIQAVSRHWCEWYPDMTFTDCMGVYPASWGGPEDRVRVTLGEWRNWTAPPKCWQSNNYGFDAPVPYQC
jgi:hypothetical protein